jgi:hypothetical protein
MIPTARKSFPSDSCLTRERKNSRPVKWNFSMSRRLVAEKLRKSPSARHCKKAIDQEEEYDNPVR